MHALLKGVILFAALLAASPSSAKITFNEVKKACWPDIAEFLGDVPWTGHAYRVNYFSVIDFGRRMDVSIRDVPWTGQYEPSGPIMTMWGDPVRDVRITLHRRGEEQTTLIELTFVDSAFRKDSWSQKQWFLNLLYFQARKSWDAPVWFVTRPGPYTDAARLFSTDGYGTCVFADYGPGGFVILPAKYAPG